MVQHRACNWAYGIDGPPQGHWYAEPADGELKLSTSAYERPAPHACFIQSVADDLVNEGGIMDLWVREARIFKYGSGTGSNFSDIRGENERLSGGGSSSGLMSFLKIGDRAAGAIKSGGTTRRAAKMVMLDLDHPDIEHFVHWKVVEENKVAALVAGSRMLSLHLNTVVTATAEGDVEGDERFVARTNPALRRPSAARARPACPTSPSSARSTSPGRASPSCTSTSTTPTGTARRTTPSPARTRTTPSASRPTSCGPSRATTTGTCTTAPSGERRSSRAGRPKPGDAAGARAVGRHRRGRLAVRRPRRAVHDTTNEWHTCPADGAIRASNPCAEYVFLDDTACNLASLNLLEFETADGVRRRAVPPRACGSGRSCSRSPSNGAVPVQPVARGSYDYRTLGLGYANLGALRCAGHPVRLARGAALCGALTAIMHFSSLAATAEMAGELGPFPAYERNAEAMLRVVRNHRRAAYAAAADAYEGLTVTPVGIDAAVCPPALLQAAARRADRMLALGEQHGYRNAQVTVIAPTGTIGLVMDCDTTGIEPDFALVKFKKLAGGGYFKIINASVPPALANLGYTPRAGRRHRPLLPRLRHARGLPAHGARQAAAARVHRRRDRDARRRHARARSTCSSPSTAGRSATSSAPSTSASTPTSSRQPGFDLLSALGFTAAEIDEANLFVCGTMTVEGAPHLKAEHLPVFDCANKCGKLGKRSSARWRTSG